MITIDAIQHASLKEKKMILQARCNKGRGNCRINFEFPDGTEQIVVQAACGNPGCTSHQHAGLVPDPPNWHYGTRWAYEGLLPVGSAAPYLVWCTAHHEMMYFKRLRTSRSTDPCGPDCREAEGGKCKCSCGGLNHGVDAQ